MMKNNKAKIITGIAVAALSGVIFSFTSESNGEPQSRKYEVIRMVDGQMTEFDTIVPTSSNYSAEDYLNDLGFGNDENISIIDLSDFESQEMTFVGTPKGEEQVVIEVEDGSTHTNTDGQHEIRVEKRVVMNSDGTEEDVEVEVDVDGMLEGMNIDSLIQVAIEMSGDSGNVVMHKMIVIDEEQVGDGDDFEWHEMNTEGATYHSEKQDGNRHMEVAVWGDGEDFTLLIVSDPETNQTKMASLNQESGKEAIRLYPNPAKSSTMLQLNFDTNAPTLVTVSDIKGNIILKLDLGNFSGSFNHEIDLSKWSSGVYLVQIDHGDTKLMEKLIVD